MVVFYLLVDLYSGIEFISRCMIAQVNLIQATQLIMVNSFNFFPWLIEIEILVLGYLRFR